ncbi:hypothetical protein B0T11DRAFT_302997 [Plectosphaerella cucumerina]|uniref:Uncharacterized protein n=1 Tax=Plectosphaerella cucumerina TaxID=40658 RepID=A0A8K0X017_9PEZI|nr:hypothetical protein B0T11DRAFT_302997 [Plectosphaerella cucumerina]
MSGNNNTTAPTQDDKARIQSTQPHYRRWSGQTSAPAGQLADVIATLIELIPVGCPVPQPFEDTYNIKSKGNAIKVLRDAIAVPNGLSPMVIGGTAQEFKAEQSDISDNGVFVDRTKCVSTDTKPAQNTPKKAKTP